MRTAEDYAKQIGAEWLELMEFNGVITVLHSKGMTVEDAQAKLDAVLNPPIATNAQIRKWLILNVGPTAIAMVDGMLAGIEDPTLRELALADWQYANHVLRDNPLVAQIGLSLGLTKEQLDAKYAEAAGL